MQPFLAGRRARAAAVLAELGITPDCRDVDLLRRAIEAGVHWVHLARHVGVTIACLRAWVGGKRQPFRIRGLTPSEQAALLWLPRTGAWRRWDERPGVPPKRVWPRLMKVGLVESRRAEADRRVVERHLTASGRLEALMLRGVRQQPIFRDLRKD